MVNAELQDTVVLNDRDISKILKRDLFVGILHKAGYNFSPSGKGICRESHWLIASETHTTAYWDLYYLQHLGLCRSWKEYYLVRMKTIKTQNWKQEMIKQKLEKCFWAAKTSYLQFIFRSNNALLVSDYYHYYVQCTHGTQRNSPTLLVNAFKYTVSLFDLMISVMPINQSINVSSLHTEIGKGQSEHEHCLVNSCVNHIGFHAVIC